MAPDEDPLDDADLECVRNSFIELFNARDLDGIQDLLTDDVEFADARSRDDLRSLTCLPGCGCAPRKCC